MGTQRDALLAGIAAAQHGLFTREQARFCGFPARTIQHRVSAGVWRKVNPSVLSAAAAPITWQQRVLAACLALDGVASHETAGQLQGMSSSNVTES